MKLNSYIELTDKDIEYEMGRLSVPQIQKLFYYHSKGYNDSQIAREIGCVRDTVMEYRKKFNLKANKR